MAPSSVDVLGSLVEDKEPRFSLPTQMDLCTTKRRKLWTQSYLHERRPGLQNLLPSVDCALQLVSQLAAMLSENRPCKGMALNIMLPVATIAHNILSLPKLPVEAVDTVSRGRLSEATPSQAIAELARLSGLSMVALVMKASSGDTQYCDARRKHPVRELMQCTTDQDWIGLDDLRLWVVVIHFLLETKRGRQWFLCEITRLLTKGSAQSWDGLLARLHRVAWVEGLDPSGTEQLRAHVNDRPIHK